MKNMLFVFIIFFVNTEYFAQQEFVYPSEDPVFSISFPDDWTVNLDEASLEAYPADESIYYGLVALGENDIDDALDAADATVANMLDDLEYEDPEEGEYNGIRFIFIAGSGYLPDGYQCNLEIGIFTVDDVNYFMSLYFGTPDAEELYAEEIEFIVTSLTAL